MTVTDLATYRRPARELGVDHADELMNITLSRMAREFAAAQAPARVFEGLPIDEHDEEKDR